MIGSQRRLQEGRTVDVGGVGDVVLQVFQRPLPGGGSLAPKACNKSMLSLACIPTRSMKADCSQNDPRLLDS